MGKGTGEGLHITGDLTIRQARELFDLDTGYTVEGNRAPCLVWITYGGAPLLPEWLTITLPFPNTAGRRRWVDQHDIHHILTGYPTSWSGESKLSALELGSYG